MSKQNQITVFLQLLSLSFCLPQISGYGLRAFRSENTDRSQMGEYELYRRKLWTAPELLRMRDRPHYGTPEGDVYAFAVILQELNFRSMPYFLDTMAPKGKGGGLNGGSPKSPVGFQKWQCI